MLARGENGWVENWSVIDWIKSLPVDRKIAPDDQMYSADWERHYFYVGASALLALLNAVNIGCSYPGGDRSVEHILDFGCGHGRVARYLRAAFPSADLYVTDYGASGVNWCVDNFNCKDVGNDLPRQYFDLIWLGSVFTHLPENVADALIEKLCAS